MQLPQSFISSLHGIKEFDAGSFTDIHTRAERITSIRLNPTKAVANPLFDEQATEAVPWSRYGYYLHKRPSFTFDPLFHAGCYYVQEASSMFVEQAFLQTVNTSQSIRVLDLCAAPGGKSTHLQTLLNKQSLLVSNEVIRARVNILKDNIIKWGSSNVVVTHNDPKDFALLPAYFDVIVADAPCSGSGLFRRDAEAIKEWSENNVLLCSQRQQRIIADVLPALKENGILIYSTCSFSTEEDEAITDWAVRELGLETMQLSLDERWKITEVITSRQNYCYRFWPNLVKGEGFFLSVFKKKSEQAGTKLKAKNATEKASKKDLDILKHWVNVDGLEFIKNKNNVYAWPAHLYSDMQLLLQQLRVIYSGTLTGEIMRDKLVPDHALAMSGIMNDRILKADLSYNDAIAYLQRKDIEPGNEKGWQLASYQNATLGWMNVLPNRVNNYYPKDLRILKDLDI